MNFTELIIEKVGQASVVLFSSVNQREELMVFSQDSNKQKNLSLN